MGFRMGRAVSVARYSCRFFLAVFGIVFLLWHPVLGETSNATTQSITDPGNGLSGPNLGAGWVQNAFQSGEVNLPQGNLQLSETDLSLPGKNGLDVTIRRTYNSRNWENSPVSSPRELKLWGNGAGKGWNFNIGMRATVFETASANCNKVVIEDNGGMETYQKVSDGQYRSKRPGNNTIVRVGSDFSWIEMVANGVTYRFGEEVVNTQLFDGNNAKIAVVKCYGISRIQDLSGNNIVFQYESYSLAKNYDEDGFFYGYDYYIERWNRDRYIRRLKARTIDAQLTEFQEYESFCAKNGMIVLGGTKFWEWLKSQPLGIQSGNVAWLYSKRISTVVDSYGRTISFGYNPGSKSGLGWDEMIGSISYSNTNGHTQTISYSYYDDQTLQNIKVGSVPGVAYEYGKLFRSSVSMWAEVPDPLVLKKATSPLGSSVAYQYDYVWAYKDNVYQPKETGAAVVGKTIANGGNVDSILFKYPTRSGISIDGPTTSYIYDASYMVPYGDDPTAQTRYFSTVTVDNPTQLEDQVFAFKNSLPISTKQGINETQTTWNLDNQVQKKVAQLVNGIVQRETETLSWDSYFNPTQVVTRKGTVDLLKQEMEYSSDPTLIGQNLIHLPTKTTRYPVSNPAQKRIQRVVYNSQGKPVELYEGDTANGRLLKQLSYDINGRVIEERTQSPLGDQVATTKYQDMGTKLVVTTSKAGKSAVTEFSKNTGRAIKQTDLNGGITTIIYDDYERPVQVTYPDGAIETTQYSADLKTTTITHGGRTVISKVDGLGRTLWVNNPLGEDDVFYDYYFGPAVSKVTVGQLNGDAITGTVKKQTTYDTKLRKTAVTTDFGTVSYTYDDANRKVKVTDPKGRYAETASDELGRKVSTFRSADATTIRYFYNDFGDLIKTIDPRGLVRKLDVDTYGRLTQSYFPGSSEGNLSVQSIPTYVSNLPGIIDTATVKSRDGQTFRTYQYGYDPEGRISQTKLGGTVQETTYYD